MGSNNFFSKLASVDPVAQAFHLPGSQSYKQGQASAQAGASAQVGGPYSGVTPTLAGANAGYAPGGPGATVGWRPWAPTGPSGLMGFMQRAASPLPGGTPDGLSGVPQTAGQMAAGNNPYAQAARGAQAQSTWSA